jgi:hypothetical protein
MRIISEHSSPVVYVALAAIGLALFCAAADNASAQAAPTASATNSFNPPPCDYNDTFYKDNGLDPTQVVGRFGTARRTGPPATGRLVNWVADSTCSQRDPDRRNFRILATTAGYPDDGTGTANNFISLLGFIVNQTAFETTYSRTVGAINGGLDGDQQNPGETISIVNSANPRGIAMQDLVGNFEAYPAPKQRLANGKIALNPCQTDMVSPLAPATPCFDLSNVSAVFSPNLRQDWRFATNRNAMDGSDNNCINNDPNVCAGINDSPFGYFCDDLLGMWINTFFWYTVDPANPGTTCGPILTALGKKNGLTTDGTPIIKTADELNNQLEANGCGAEGQMNPDGTDGGAIWDVCPAIPDPRAGAIAKDAFLDQTFNNNGKPQNPGFTQNFLALQKFGLFFNELTASQQSTVNSSVSPVSSTNPAATPAVPAGD